MRYFLDPFGCVKNQVDAENMMAALNQAGWSSSDPDDADLIIINSCGFIESAKRESIDAVLGWRARYPKKKILLAGCLSQRYQNELKESLPEADGFFGTENIFEIPAAASAVISRSKKKLTANDSAPDSAGLAANPGNRPLLSMPGSAYVKISEGCDNHCSYCAIPLIRGNLKSRKISEIIAECKTLLKRGVKEICLIGQDIGSFGSDRKKGADAGLPELLEKISLIKGRFWVRLLYIHPDHFPVSILDIMKDPRFLPYFDLPFQSGSEKILRLMNRSGSAEQYLGLIKKIRGIFEEAVIRSTFLVGFPGETEEDFRLTVDFQKKASLDWAGCFAYSREEGTPAYLMKGRVPKKIANERRKIIEENQVPITEKQMDRFVGRDSDVLVEEKIEGAELWLGRLPFQAPDIDGSAVISCDTEPETGTLVHGKISGRAGFDMKVIIAKNRSGSL